VRRRRQLELQQLALGMQLGNLYEVKLAIEGMNGDDDDEFSHATVSIN
jgi:hypothetical protein